MTLLVGIYCKGGVVIATDSAATFGTGYQPTIGQQMAQKIFRPCDHMIYAGTGAVGIAQLIASTMGDQWRVGAYAKVTSAEGAMNAIGQDIGKLVAQYLHLGSFQKQIVGQAEASLTKSMMAFPVKKEPRLFQFDVNGAPEMATDKLPFIALGSGQPIADPFLAFLARLVWPTRRPTLAEGRLAAAWTIDHVRRTNPGGVGGNTCMSILQERGAELPIVTDVDGDSLGEHMQRIESVEKRIAQELTGEGQSTGASSATPPQLPDAPVTGSGPTKA